MERIDNLNYRDGHSVLSQESKDIAKEFAGQILSVEDLEYYTANVPGFIKAFSRLVDEGEYSCSSIMEFNYAIIQKSTQNDDSILRDYSRGAINLLKLAENDQNLKKALTQRKFYIPKDYIQNNLMSPTPTEKNDFNQDDSLFAEGVGVGTGIVYGGGIYYFLESLNQTHLMPDDVIKWTTVVMGATLGAVTGLKLDKFRTKKQNRSSL